MSFCGNCGHYLSENGFCPNCGEANAPPTEFVMPDMRTEHIPPALRTENLVPNTGGRQQYVQQPKNTPVQQMNSPVQSVVSQRTEPKKEPPKKKKKGLLITLISVAAVLLIGGGVFLGLFLSGAFEKEDVVEPWEKLTFSLDGEEYTLPCDVRKFLDNGCTIVTENKQGKTDGDIGMMTPNGEVFSVIVSLEDEDDEMKDGRAVGIFYLDAEGTEFADGVKLSKLDSTDAIIDAFGEPNSYSRDGGCVYRTERATMEVRCEDGCTYLFLSAPEAVELGYAPRTGTGSPDDETSYAPDPDDSDEEELAAAEKE